MEVGAVDDFELAVGETGDDFAILNDERFGVRNFDFEPTDWCFGEVLEVGAEESL